MIRQVSKKRLKWLRLLLAAFAVSCVLYLWLPYRVAMVRIFFWFGGSRLLIAAKYESLDSPTYVPVAEAPQYSPEAEVFALASSRVAKAVPQKRIAWHLVMNDELDGEPIVVTHCTVTDSALAYRAVCGGRSLHFAPARLARNNLVMRDLETGSSWQQFTGEAVDGVLAGSTLERVPLQRMRLADWERQYPSGVVLEPTNRPSDTSAPNDKCPVMCYFPSEPFLLQQPGNEDSRLPRKQAVVGALLPTGEAVARPADLETTLPSRPSASEVKCYWFAWVEFYPNTSLLMSR